MERGWREGGERREGDVTSSLSESTAIEKVASLDPKGTDTVTELPVYKRRKKRKRREEKRRESC